MQYVKLLLVLCVCAFSAVCGGDLFGDSGHVPWHHHGCDVSYEESIPANWGRYSCDCPIHSAHVLPVHICLCVCVWFCPQAVTIANILSSIVNLGLILLMGRIYTALAEQLTKWGKNQSGSKKSEPQ